MNSSSTPAPSTLSRLAASIAALSGRLLLLELLALPLIAVSSWICSIYDSGVRSLLSPDGLRWIATSVVDNFAAMPIAHILLFLIGLSLLLSSGITSVFRAGRRAVPISPKQQRAVVFALVMLLLNVLLLLALTFLPPYVLLNFFGTLTHSPLTDSLPCFCLLLIETVCSTYAYTSGRLTTVRDFTAAHTMLLVRLSPLFLHLFLWAQILGWLGYSSLC